MPVVHVPYFAFLEDAEAAIARLPRDREMVVVCGHGGSSELVAGLLAEAGIAAANVRGGMMAYGDLLEAVPVPLAAAERARFSLWQVNRRGKGCLSYVIVSGAEAVVVDASRDTAWYEAFVAAQGARVVRVLDTHVHADHVSGGPELAERLRVPYFVDAGEGFELRRSVNPLADGERLRLGGPGGVVLEVTVLHTPGHTPGSASYLLDGRYLLSGDTLFVGAIGRPDLGGHVEEWGRALFDTLSRRLAALPPETVVLPAHHASLREIGPDGVVVGPARGAAALGPRDPGNDARGVRRGRACGAGGPSGVLRRDRRRQPRRHGARGPDRRVGARPQPVRRGRGACERRVESARRLARGERERRWL